MAKRVIQWLSPLPAGCDICNKPFGKFFIDGKTKMSGGQWALMCEECHAQHGSGLGMGFGQKYDKATKIKVEG